MNLAHLHLLLNHFPTIGFGIGLGVFLVALIGKSEELKRTSLGVFVLIALLTIPVYVSGKAAQTALADGPDTLIAQHQDAALLAFIFMELTGMAAWFALWQPSGASGMTRWNVPVVLILSMLTFLLMARAANMGGEIRHPEIVSADSTEAGEQPADSGTGLVKPVASFVIDYTWVWAVSETFHFIGMVLLFSVVIVNLRVLGVMKKVSFVALHRLLPWAILGFAINAVTGMLFFVAAAEQYTQNPAFYWKMLFIVLAGINVLYLTISDRAAAVGSGDDAPLTAKVIAASGIFLWFGVVFWGRLLPFLGLRF